MYGMPENYGSISGTVYGNTGSEKKPLPNVKIYGTGKGLETSLEDGSLFKTGRTEDTSSTFGTAESTLSRSRTATERRTDFTRRSK